MSIRIVVLIARTIIFKINYKISSFRAGPTPNGFRQKNPNGFSLKDPIFSGLIKLSPNLVIFRSRGFGIQP